MALSFAIKYELRTPGGRRQLRGLSMRPQEFLRLPRAEPWGQLAGEVAWASGSTPALRSMLTFRKTIDLGNFQTIPWPSSATIWTQQEALEGVLLGSCPHLGLSMGLGQEVSCSRRWLPEACPAPSASPATYCKDPKAWALRRHSGRALGLASIQQSCWGLPSCSHPEAWTQLPLLASSALLHQNNF